MIQSSQGASAAMKSPGTATPEIVPRSARKMSEMTVMMASSRTSISLDLDDHLDLDRDADGELRHADRGPRVLADRLAEHLHHQVREAVDDLGLVTEVLRGPHHAQHLHDALDLVEIPERGAHRGEQVEADFTRDLVAFLDRHVLAELAARTRPTLADGTVTGEEQEIADAHRADVVRHRGRRRRERDVLLFQTRFRAHAL